ncbi:DNA-binding domain-containing protein [Treponema pedis]|uniref:DNA-binding domain-containing protein n=2 Tax=Treponema pedis TaxID=409322 RepID=UPI00041C4611|nr:DNA-binding domain-containing protein [Treponema pedis]
MLKYCLRENLLTAKPDDYMAQVTDSQVYTLDDIIERMVKRGTTVTRTDLAALMQLYTQECTYIIEEGGTLNTPIVNTSFSISGTFNGADDSFDGTRHAVHLNIAAGLALKEALGKVKVTKTETAGTDPYITAVNDKLNGIADTVKIGSVMEILGSRLKFDPEDTEQGVFAVSGTTAVRCASVIENKPARLIVLLDPSVPQGDFTLEVRTKLINNGSKPSKTLKKGYYHRPLKAVP